MTLCSCVDMRYLSRKLYFLPRQDKKIVQQIEKE